MSDHNAPYQIIERRIDDATMACGYRVEWVHQYWDKDAYDSENRRWGMYCDVPVVRLKEEG